MHPLFGRVLGPLPLSWRYAPYYSIYQRDFNRIAGSQTAITEYQFAKFKRLVEHAVANIPFYRWFYHEHDFDPGCLGKISDITKVPIVRKADLADWSIEQRSCLVWFRRRANTGGTSGRPLGFYVDRAAYAREWFHMLRGWERLGYRPSAQKLTLRGVNIGQQIYHYRFIQNEFLWNIFKPLDTDAIQALKSLLSREDIRYLHGYPSAIYQFLKELEDREPGFCRAHFHFNGVFMGSEYPDRVQRIFIEEMLDCPTLSWYGHSEQAVLAMETEEQFVYRPFSTYGLAEAVASSDSHSLVATGFDNFASPFIRYDTEDPVIPIEVTAGVLQAFSMVGGRAGEVVTDATGKLISLTGLLYGRHHSAFEHFEYVQLHQPEPGKLLVMIVAKTPIDFPERYFDFSGLQFNFTYRTIPTPYRAANGKIVPLLKVIENL